jgi:hypothetical protein
MTIETIYKLKLTSNEKEILDKCHALLEEIIGGCRGDELSNEVEIDSVVFTSDTLLNLMDIAEVYK